MGKVEIRIEVDIAELLEKGKEFMPAILALAASVDQDRFRDTIMVEAMRHRKEREKKEKAASGHGVEEDEEDVNRQQKEQKE